MPQRGRLRYPLGLAGPVALIVHAFFPGGPATRAGNSCVVGRPGVGGESMSRGERPKDKKLPMLNSKARMQPMLASMVNQPERCRA